MPDGGGLLAAWEVAAGAARTVRLSRAESMGGDKLTRRAACRRAQAANRLKSGALLEAARAPAERPHEPNFRGDHRQREQGPASAHPPRADESRAREPRPSA